jgi:hypothetical protein
VLRWLEMLGLDPETADSLVITPSCGLGSADAGWARRAMELSQTVAVGLRG